ncbi:MAG: hypothetical protein A2107_01120 [Verrucomicrobia bacterium GWF2_62_7]|nr:MAG: hypothetical protein A2107_01120 [Verrucomicrobia bacterium GWF2_62_7]
MDGGALLTQQSQFSSEGIQRLHLSQYFLNSVISPAQLVAVRNTAMSSHAVLTLRVRIRLWPDGVVFMSDCLSRLP